MFKVERMFRAVRDAQHSLHLRGAQALVHRPRAISWHCAVLGAMNEEHAGPVRRDKQLREDGVLSGGQGSREASVAFRTLLVRGEERAHRVA